MPIGSRSKRYHDSIADIALQRIQKDMAGKTYGKLTVTDVQRQSTTPYRNTPGATNPGLVRWRYLAMLHCSCGSMFYAPLYPVIQGKYKACQTCIDLSQAR